MNHILQLPAGELFRKRQASKQINAHLYRCTITGVSGILSQSRSTKLHTFHTNKAHKHWHNLRCLQEHQDTWDSNKASMLKIPLHCGQIYMEKGSTFTYIVYKCIYIYIDNPFETSDQWNIFIISPFSRYFEHKIRQINRLDQLRYPVSSLFGMS